VGHCAEPSDLRPRERRFFITPFVSFLGEGCPCESREDRRRVRHGPARIRLVSQSRWRRRMYYSTYRTLLIAGTAIVVVIIDTFFVIAAGAVGVILAIVFAMFGLIAYWMNIVWMDRAMDDFDGVPAPGLWGVLGVDIIPDETDVEGVFEPRRDFDTRERPLAPSRARSVARKGCPKCGAVTEGVDSKFCRVCGGPLET